MTPRYTDDELLDAKTVRENPLEALVVDETATLLADRIGEGIEMDRDGPVTLPTEERFIAVLTGAVGVGEATHRPVALDGMAERTAEDRALTYLLGAWAAWALAPEFDGHPGSYGPRWVAKHEVTRVAETGTWRALRADGWTAERGESMIGIRHRRVGDAVVRLYGRYGAASGVRDEHG